MNKKWFSLLFILLLAITLVGCSANNTNTESNNSQPPQNEKVDDQPRIIKHAMGETPITGTPKSVVVLTNESTEAVLALGVKPVGAVNSSVGYTWYPHIVDQMQGVTELGEETMPNLETIASLKPDLIIGNKIRHEEIYEQLSSIAPTVFSEDLAGQWKVNFNLYAEALNKEAEGKVAMGTYNAHVTEVQKELADKLSLEISIVRFLPTTVRIYQKDTFAGTVLQDLGFSRPASQDKDNFMEVITEEQMDAMDGDVMFYFNADYDEEKGGTKMQEEWMAHPLFAKLHVAEQNTAFRVDEVIWNLSGGILSANLLLDDIVKFLK